MAGGPAVIKNNDYTIEFFQGPLLAPIRVEGLAGAYSALAEGVEGTSANAAAPAVREPYSFQWLDLDVDLGVSFPGSFSNTDFDNHGVNANGTFDQVNDFVYVNFGARLQLGDLGLSASGDLLSYTIHSGIHGTPALSLVSGRYHVLAAYALAHEQIAVGAGLRGVSMQLSPSQSSFDPEQLTFDAQATLTMTGVSPEAGVLVKPDNFPVRFGATVRAPVSGTTVSSEATTVGGVSRTGGLVVPDGITLPWEIETGFAVQVGPRPLNPSWRNPHDEEAPVHNTIEAARARRGAEYEEALAQASPGERDGLRASLDRQEEAIRVIEDARLKAESDRLLGDRTARFENWPRARILLVASALVTGASSHAVALEGFIDQRVESVGQQVTVSPRIGIEAEPIQDHVIARLGSYVEPSRFEGVDARQHFTFGADLKLLPWNMFGITPGQTWRFGAVLDVAPRYIDWGFAFGAWH